MDTNGKLLKIHGQTPNTYMSTILHDTIQTTDNIL